MQRAAQLEVAVAANNERSGQQRVIARCEWRLTLAERDGKARRVVRAVVEVCRLLRQRKSLAALAGDVLVADGGVSDLDSHGESSGAGERGRDGDTDGAGQNGHSDSCKCLSS